VQLVRRRAGPTSQQSLTQLVDDDGSSPPPFRFQEEREPAEYVEQLAEQMLPTTRYDDIHILKGPYVMENWDPELIEVRD